MGAAEEKWRVPLWRSSAAAWAAARLRMLSASMV
jgi:hypothetical protein